MVSSLYLAWQLTLDFVQVSLILFALFGIGACVWLPTEAYAVMNNATTLMGCVGDQYAETVTTRLVLELQSSCKRSAAMLRNDVVREFGLLPVLLLLQSAHWHVSLSSSVSAGVMEQCSNLCKQQPSHCSCVQPQCTFCNAWCVI